MPTPPSPAANPNARFLAGAVRRDMGERAQFGNSILGSAFMHVGSFLLTVFVIGRMPVTPPATVSVDDEASEMVWLNVPGPGRRGGSPGDGKPAAPRQAERPSGDTMALAVAAPLSSPTEINIPEVIISPGVVELPGASSGVATLWSQGRAIGGGMGMGTGTRGSGVGTGDGGFGIGAFGVGSDVTMPTVLKEVKPSYTAEAMRAKVQGAVMVQAVVREDGTVGQVRVLRSLDRTFGLDEEALEAVRNWRFTPGRHQGRNVPVIVEIELMFTLR
jgi:periplasmic protein TonB